MKINWNKKNSMVISPFSVFDWNNPFFSKFVPENQNCQLKLKFGT